MAYKKRLINPIGPSVFVKFARLAEGGYEYGDIECTFDIGAKKNYIVRGKRATLEAALKANKMAPKGAPHLGGAR